jgi:hypothetical protein
MSENSIYKKTTVPSPHTMGYKMTVSCYNLLYKFSFVLHITKHNCLCNRMFLNLSYLSGFNPNFVVFGLTILVPTSQIMQRCYTNICGVIIISPATTDHVIYQFIITATKLDHIVLRI